MNDQEPNGGWDERAATAVLHAIRRKRLLVFERGLGTRLWDAAGREYLDGISGTNGPAMVGHSHPAVVAAVSEQMARLPSTFIGHDSTPLVRFAEDIGGISPVGPCKTFLCPGGGEGAEAAIKLAMRITGRTEVISLHGAYHGMSLATMSLGGIPALREWFPGSLRWPTFHQVSRPDTYRSVYGSTNMDVVAAVADFEAAIDRGSYGRIAAVIFEIVQGPGGHVVFPEQYYLELERICRDRGILIIVDEVQTALGRCGAEWATSLASIRPDMVVIGKAFGGGFPFGGIIVRADLIDDAIEESPWHILTFMNQPVQAAAGSAVVRIVQEERLVNRAQVLGRAATARFRELQERYRVVGDVRGPGLFIGIDLVEDRATKAPATAACERAWEFAIERGLITWFGGDGNVLKFKPPITSTDEDFELLLDLYEDVIRFVEHQVHGERFAAAKKTATTA